MTIYWSVLNNVVVFLCFECGDKARPNNLSDWRGGSEFRMVTLSAVRGLAERER